MSKITKLRIVKLVHAKVVPINTNCWQKTPSQKLLQVSGMACSDLTYLTTSWSMQWSSISWNISLVTKMYLNTRRPPALISWLELSRVNWTLRMEREGRGGKGRGGEGSRGSWRNGEWERGVEWRGNTHSAMSHTVRQCRNSAMLHMYSTHTNINSHANNFTGMSALHRTQAYSHTLL